MVSSVRTKREGFWGDTTGYAPDLVAATHPGTTSGLLVSGEDESGEHQMGANHVWNDAIVFTPYPIAAGRQPMIWMCSQARWRGWASRCRQASTGAI